MVSIRSRIERLEQASGSSVTRPVVVMADGHSRDEIGVFLKSQGIQDKWRQPMIIFNGGCGEIIDGPCRPLRIG